MSTQGDLLRQLFRGYKKRDDVLFKRAAEEIIKDEKAKNHRLLADDLEKILLNGNNGSFYDSRVSEKSFEIPKDRERGFPLIEISEYSYNWDRIILSQKTTDLMQRICNENYKRDILASSGISPRQKLLFFGPPGCGKTLAAKVFASELQIPLVTVRFDAIVSSYLGETATNLRKVFEFIERGQWVVLFDEFDAIGKDRDNPLEHGELKRVVNTLLQLMDAFRGESLLIAATNHESLLDSAIWRRFEAVIPFSLPTEQDRVLMLRLFLKGMDHSSVDIASIAKKLKDASGSDIEQLAKDIARNAILSSGGKITLDDVEEALSSLRDRIAIVKKLSSRENPQE